MTAVVPTGPYDEVVSLGRSCQVAHQLRHQLGIDRAHVFDWIMTTDPGLLQLVETGLDGHFSPARLVRDASGRSYDPLTGTTFPHDLPTGRDLAQAWSKAAPRVAALVQRWREVMVSGKTVLFVRQHGWRPDPVATADRLFAALARAAPHLRFRLLYLTEPRLFQATPDRPGLLHRPLVPVDGDDWRGDDETWRVLMDEVMGLPRPDLPGPQLSMQTRKPEPNLGPYDEIVSLGRDCQVAHQLRKTLGIERAHVFDWIGTPDPAILQHVQTGLDGFFAADNLRRDDRGYVRDPRNGTTFLHVFPQGSDLDTTRAEAAPRFAAMTERWRDLMRSDRAILFVRRHGFAADPLATADRLIAALSAAAPRLRFRLLYLTAPGLYRPQDDRPGLLHRPLPDPDPPDWRGDPLVWQALLDEALRLPPLPPLA